jgi:hypothetical protein
MTEDIKVPVELVNDMWKAAVEEDCQKMLDPETTYEEVASILGSLMNLYFILFGTGTPTKMKVIKCDLSE